MSNRSRYMFYRYVVPAGGVVTINKSARFIAIFECSQALQMTVDNESPGEIMAGIQIGFEVPFTRIELVNPHAEAVTIELGVANGVIQDSRMAASGTLFVADPSGSGRSFDDVVSELTQQTIDFSGLLDGVRSDLTDGQSLRAGVTSLGANKYGIYNPAGGVKTIFTAGSAGAIIRNLVIASSGSYVGAYLDTSAPSSYTDASKRIIAYSRGTTENIVRTNMLVPSGISLYMANHNTNCCYYIDWDQL